MTKTDSKDTKKEMNEPDYLEIIQSKTEVDPDFIGETGKPAKIIYYCKDCETLIAPKRIGKKIQFSCPECKGKNVAFGTEVAIANYYSIPEGKKTTSKPKKEK